MLCEKGWFIPAFNGAPGVLAAFALLSLVAFVLLGGVSLSPASRDGVLHRIDSLETANHAINARLAETERMLAELQHGTGSFVGTLPLADRTIAEQLRVNRLALAILQLRIASQTHLPFGPELALVQQLGRGEAGLSAALTALTPNATTGVATVPELRDSFGVILFPRLQPLLEGRDTGSWTSSALNWVNQVIPLFTPSTGSNNAQKKLVVSATDRLTSDDLRGAVLQLSELNGPAAALVARWLKEANARLAVDTASNALSEITVALFNHTP